MERIELVARRRQVVGKKVRFLRREGLLPAVLYGHNVPSQPLQLDTRSLVHAFARGGKNVMFDLRVEGERPRPVFIRDIQRDPRTDEPLHADFFQVAMTEEVRVEVPVLLTGSAPAVDEWGGMLLHSVDTLQVEGLPGDIPARIEVDLSSLAEIGASIHVRDLPPMPGLRVLNDPEEVLATVERPRVEEEVRPPEAEAPPEAAPAEEAKEEEERE